MVMAPVYDTWGGDGTGLALFPAGRSCIGAANPRRARPDGTFIRRGSRCGFAIRRGVSRSHDEGSRRTAAMKADIHPHYHVIKVVMTDGTEFATRSTYGSEGATLNLDIDPKTHPAWTGGTQQLLDRGGRLSRFNARFGSIGQRK
jgi:large subunit ribosomal protein L31